MNNPIFLSLRIDENETNAELYIKVLFFYAIRIFQQQQKQFDAMRILNLFSFLFK